MKGISENMYCSNCGKKVKDGADICFNCGKEIPRGINKYITAENLPEEYKPISMWGYFGYQILFAIPIIGWIILIVYAIGGAPNINVRNFARSYFCFYIIAETLLLIVYLS